MAFQNSKHLSNLYAIADASLIEREAKKLLRILGIGDQSVAHALAEEPVRVNSLEKIRIWNRRILANSARDETGKAACLFWAAQAIANLVLTATALDPSKKHPAELTLAMERGAEGLYFVGKDQFSKLVHLINSIVMWAKSQEITTLFIVESPLGNTVPTQLLKLTCAAHSIPAEVRVWSAPRNDRRVRGRTVNDAASEFCDDLPETATVILLDDVITGSRFIKLFDALREALGERSLVPAAMVFDRDRLTNFDRLKHRVDQCAAELGFQHGLTDFPAIPIFRIDAGELMRWESPVIWGESDLIAGKRKVNFIFTLINHLFDIAEDLIEDDSEYRHHLERSWQEDSSGQVYSPPIPLKDILKNLCTRLNLFDFFKNLDKQAKAEFEDDYKGCVKYMDEKDVLDRWQWIEERFVEIASKSLNTTEAGFLWRACKDTFAATRHTHRPRPARDHDFSPYTLPYNPTIAAFNQRLLTLLIEHSEANFPHSKHDASSDQP
ncbi:hypothetical protein BGC_04800 [Burkholderia sp. 3C]